MRERGERRTIAILASLVLVVLFVYTRKLGQVPPYLHHDEVFFAIQAQSIAATGHDTQGRWLPLYVEVYPGFWFLPAVVYFTAFFLRMVPASEAAFRLPTVCIALFNVVAVYFIARRLFQRVVLAVVAAGLMAFTPAHLIHARLAMDYLYPVPFLLAWLWLLLVFLEHGRASHLFWAGTCLGLGFYTYIAAAIMMPVYVMTTCAVLWARADRSGKLIAIVLAGFFWPILLSIPFHMQYPEVLQSKWTVYGVANSGQHLDPLQQVSELFNYNSLTSRVSLYFNFFNPAYLFMSGGSNILNSTRRAGVFLMPLAVFVPVGIYQVLRHRRTAATVVVLAGFFSAPLAALTIFESGAIDRELEVLPFGVLLATFGIELLWGTPLRTDMRRWFRPVVAAGVLTAVGYGVWTLARRGHVSASTVPLLAACALIYGVGAATTHAKNWRPMTVCLLLLAFVEFQSFYRDYLGDYRLRAVGHFEWNRRGAEEQILARLERGHHARVFISQQIQYGDLSWHLYTRMLRRDDLENAITYFRPDLLEGRDIPPGSLVWTTSTAADDQRFIDRTGLTILAQIFEPDGTVSFVLLEKTD
jgi:4-amino-4-deoxy-L-arabinose transferase-like glycosyltransferase